MPRAASPQWRRVRLLCLPPPLDFVLVKVPAEAPVMILPETTLFPGMTLPLRIFEPR